MINQIVELLEKKDRPYLSSIIYFICGIIMIIVSFIQVLPVKINIDYFNNIDFEAKLDDNSYIVILTLVLWILYVIMFVIRRVAIHFSNKLSDEIFNNRCVILYSVEDTIDLITSITSLVFILTASLQFYKTEQLYVTALAVILYSFIGLKFLSFVLHKIYYHNKKIINDILKIDNKAVKII